MARTRSTPSPRPAPAPTASPSRPSTARRPTARPTPQTASLSATVTPSASGYAPVVYLRSTCTGGFGFNDLACTSGTSGQPGSIFVPTLSPGTYFLFVDSATVGGAFDLAASLAAP